MGERQPRRRPDVLAGDLGAPVPRRVGDRGARGHDVGAHAVHVEGCADLRDLPQHLFGEEHRLDDLLRLDDARGESSLRVVVRRREAVRVCVEGEPAADHVNADCRVTRSRDLDGEAEPVEQLGTELALLGVHRADQHESCRVLDRDSVAFHSGSAHGRGVEEEVDQVVV